MNRLTSSPSRIRSPCNCFRSLSILVDKDSPATYFENLFLNYTTTYIIGCLASPVSLSVHNHWTAADLGLFDLAILRWYPSALYLARFGSSATTLPYIWYMAVDVGRISNLSRGAVVYPTKSHAPTDRDCTYMEPKLCNLQFLAPNDTLYRTRMIYEATPVVSMSLDPGPTHDPLTCPSYSHHTFLPPSWTSSFGMVLDLFPTSLTLSPGLFDDIAATTRLGSPQTVSPDAGSAVPSEASSASSVDPTSLAPSAPAAPTIPFAQASTLAEDGLIPSVAYYLADDDHHHSAIPSSDSPMDIVMRGNTLNLSVLSAPAPPTNQAYSIPPFSANCLVVAVGNHHTNPYTASACAVGSGFTPRPACLVADVGTRGVRVIGTGGHHPHPCCSDANPSH